MPAKQRNFIYEVGADFQRVLYLRPGPDADLTGYSGKMQIRPTADSSTVILEISTSNSRMTLGNGIITINVPNSVSIDATSCTRNGALAEPNPAGGQPYTAAGPLAVYDLEVTSGAGVETRLLQGDVCFSAATTR